MSRGHAWIEKEFRRETDGAVRRLGTSKRSKTDPKTLASEGCRVGGYYVGWREGDGKKRYQRFSTFEAARAFKTDVDHQFQEGTYVPKADRTQRLDTYVDQMLVSSHDIAPSTLSGYRSTFELHIRGPLGRRPVGEISTPELQAYVNRLVAAGAGNGTLTAVRQLLAKVFNQAWHDGILSKVPTRTLRLPKERRQKLSREVLQGWADAMGPLAAAIEHRYQLALYLAGVLGLRAGEIGGLRIQDVDFNARTITVRQAVRTVDGSPEIAPTKTSAGERVLSVPSPIVDQITAHIKEYPPADDGRIFMAARGGLVHHLTLNKVLQKAIRATGSPPMRFHDLRHLAASTMIALGIGPSVVKERLGHSTLAVTMDRYSHLFPAQDRDAADRLEAHILAKGLTSTVTVPGLPAEGIASSEENSDMEQVL